jgi:hypothetical protein
MVLKVNHTPAPPSNLIPLFCVHTCPLFTKNRRFPAHFRLFSLILARFCPFLTNLTRFRPIRQLPVVL